MEMLLNKLAELWLQDIEIFSQPYMYWWLFIPFLIYFSFFVCKWCILTLPVWLPMVLVVSMAHPNKNNNEEEDIKNDGENNSTPNVPRPGNCSE